MTDPLSPAWPTYPAHGPRRVSCGPNGTGPPHGAHSERSKTWECWSRIWPSGTSSRDDKGAKVTHNEETWPKEQLFKLAGLSHFLFIVLILAPGSSLTSQGCLRCGNQEFFCGARKACGPVFRWLPGLRQMLLPKARCDWST